MRTLVSLKAEELRVVGYIVKGVAFAKYVENKVNQYAKSAIEGLRSRIAKQKEIREKHLAFLALEVTKVETEIDELTSAHDRHVKTLKTL